MLNIDNSGDRLSWHIKNSVPIEYSIIETDDLFSIENDTLAKLGESPRRLIVIDQKLEVLYADKIDAYFDHHNIYYEVIAIPANEPNKNIDTTEKLFRAFDRFRLKRRSEPVIAIGGGVLTDVVSFAASCYRRNVPCIRIPTTLMGYIDATIGVKTGINFEKNKNRVGSFCAPLATILDRQMLATCPTRHISNGIGEIIKIAAIKDKELFELLHESPKSLLADRFQTKGRIILQRAITGMMEELEPNLHEDNLERIVDFGHTFSTLIEMEDIENLLHGEAVAIDVCFSASLACVRGLLTEQDARRIISLTQSYNLPITHSAITPQKMMASLHERSDHRDGLQRAPLPTGIGSSVFVNDINIDQLEKAVKLHENLCKEIAEHSYAV